MTGTVSEETLDRSTSTPEYVHDRRFGTEPWKAHMYSVCMPPKGGIHRLKRAFFGDFLRERECHCLDVIGEGWIIGDFCPWKGVSLAKVSLITAFQRMP